MSRTFGSPGHVALVKFIVKKREEAGLTQRDVAKKLRRHQSFVATYELRQKRIDVVELIEIADAIGFDPHEALRIARRAKR
jgi:transcriptional regulator with XRE-family HTH domain